MYLIVHPHAEWNYEERMVCRILTVVVALLAGAAWAATPLPPNSLAGATGGPGQTVSSVRRATGFISLRGFYGLGQTSQYRRGRRDVAAFPIGAYRANILRDEGQTASPVSLPIAVAPMRSGGGSARFSRMSLRLGRYRYPNLLYP